MGVVWEMEAESLSAESLLAEKLSKSAVGFNGIFGRVYLPKHSQSQRSESRPESGRAKAKTAPSKPI